MHIHLQSVSESDEGFHIAIDMERPLPHSASEPQMISHDNHVIQSTSSEPPLSPLTSSIRKQNSDTFLSVFHTPTTAESGCETKTEVIPESPSGDDSKVPNTPEEGSSSGNGVTFTVNKSTPLPIVSQHL